MPEYNPWGTPIFPGASAFGVGSPAEDAQRQPTIVDNLLSHIAGAIGRGFMAPGQALQSTTPITSDQMIAPAQDMSTAMSTGAGAFPASANELRMGIKAYHGSPHDFDAFDLSKIGTGEGAQAYGHGLYFADSEGVAKSYRDTLSRAQKGETLVNGQPLEALPPELQSKAFTYWNTGDKSLIAGTPLETAKFETKPPGRMYEVNINAEPDHFLDWDKPLSQQPEAVRNALSLPPQAARINDALVAKGHPEMTAGNAYTEIRNAGGGSPSALTDKLQQAGIPGIKYLDQGSRGAGQGSSNYVVFNDKLIDILKKYAIPGMLAPIFPQVMGEQKS